MEFSKLEGWNGHSCEVHWATTHSCYTLQPPCNHRSFPASICRVTFHWPHGVQCKYFWLSGLWDSGAATCWRKRGKDMHPVLNKAIRPSGMWNNGSFQVAVCCERSGGELDETESSSGCLAVSIGLGSSLPGKRWQAGAPVTAHKCLLTQPRALWGRSSLLRSAHRALALSSHRRREAEPCVVASRVVECL